MPRATVPGAECRRHPVNRRADRGCLVLPPEQDSKYLVMRLGVAQCSSDSFLDQVPAIRRAASTDSSLTAHRVDEVFSGTETR